MTSELNKQITVIAPKSGQSIHIHVRERTCVDCEHFDEANIHCTKYQAKPPPRTIAYGCEGFIEEIPF